MRNQAQLMAAVQPKLLPVVKRVIEQLDILFIESAGSAGKGKLAEIYKRWLNGGKTGPSGLRHYVSALSLQLLDPAEREVFSAEAERVLLNLQSGYVS